MSKYNELTFHACLDVTDLELAAEIAKIAVSAGAAVIEVGTPLVYIYGYESIRQIRDVVPENVKIVADFKAKDRCEDVFIEAHRFGADYACVMADNNDAGILAAVQAKTKTGIKVIADMLTVPVAEMPECAQNAEKLGVDVILIHLGGDENMLGLSHGRKEYDGVAETAAAVKIPVAAVCDDPENAAEAVRRGARWIVFGLCLRDCKEETAIACKNFVDSIRQVNVHEH